MYGSMVNIQSAMAEIRRGMKKRRKKIEETTGKNVMSKSATQGGHNHLPVLTATFHTNLG